MTRKEKLQEHLTKIQEIKVEMKLIQEKWLAYNRLFNQWMQDELGVKDDKSELHLTEILSKWDKANDKSPEAGH